MSEKDKGMIKVEEAIHFEVAELDDMDLDAVAGGLQEESANGKQCTTTNVNCGC